MEKAELEQRLKINLHKYVKNYDDVNDFLVELIEQAGGYLNATPVAKYAKENGTSYPGVIKCRPWRVILENRYVTDNQ